MRRRKGLSERKLQRRLRYRLRHLIGRPNDETLRAEVRAVLRDAVAIRQFFDIKTEVLRRT